MKIRPLVALAFALTGTARADDLRPITASELCVTNGEIPADPGGFRVDAPSSRAVVRFTSDAQAEVKFRYLGPSAGDKPLASGELRRQIGLKLRAQDTCNLVYAMWHIEPDSRVAVSVKRNPGKSANEQCHAGGYINLKPTTPGSPPKIAIGEEHVLKAALVGRRLTVWADGRVAWNGDLDARAFEIDGPVGLRTDNARFAFAFLAPAARSRASTGKCERSGGD